MKRFRILLIPLFFLVSGLTADKDAGKNYLAKWVVMKGGSLKVQGSTNINNFTCEISNYSKPDTITVFKNRSDKEAISISGNLNLDIKGFDCFNPVMTADLRKTLKSKEHPYLKIRFLNLSRLPNLSLKQDFIKGGVDIELAGVKKRFEVNYKFATGGNNTILLIGDRDITFSDFNLSPPRKIGGMIKTNDELSVRFQLTLKVID